MEIKFGEMDGQHDCLDDNLQTSQNSYDGDMYNLDTRLQSMWIAQQAQIDYYFGQSYVDPRAATQRESEHLNSQLGGLEVVYPPFSAVLRAIVLNFLYRLPLSVCFCFPCLCSFATLLSINDNAFDKHKGGVYTC